MQYQSLLTKYSGEVNIYFNDGVMNDISSSMMQPLPVNYEPRSDSINDTTLSLDNVEPIYQQSSSRNYQQQHSSTGIVKIEMADRNNSQVIDTVTTTSDVVIFG